MSHVVHNGRPPSVGPPRRQLSDQLDRFDQILDGLAEGLDEAISDAVREGTRLAVKDAVVELITNPDLRAAIQGIAPKPPAPAPAAPPRSAGTKLRDLLRSTRAALAGVVRAAGSFVVRKATSAVAATVAAGKITMSVWQMKRAVLATAVVGVVVGVAAFYTAPHAGAVLSAAAGAFVAISVRTATWVRTALRPFLPV